MRKRSALFYSAGVTSLLSVAILGGERLYVHPQVDTLRHADAVLVLGGYAYDRYPFGLGLVQEGWAPNLVFSDPRDALNCNPPPPGVDLFCFVPEPATTRGEARGFAKLAAENHWRSVIVVTFVPQVSRARFIIQRCFDGEVVMVASPPNPPLSRWLFEFIYQTAGYLRALAQPGC